MVDVKIAEQIGVFQDVIVWGHAEVVGEEDKFVRGVREWVGLAEAMHGQDDGEEEEEEEEKKKQKQKGK